MLRVKREPCDIRLTNEFAFMETNRDNLPSRKSSVVKLLYVVSCDPVPFSRTYLSLPAKVAFLCRDPTYSFEPDADAPLVTVRDLSVHVLMVDSWMSIC